MIGITSWGAYLPSYRLGRDELARAWGTRSAGGQKAVACYDEDSVTMSVAAARDCLSGLGERKPGALYMATTTPPYREKLSATIVASALDCPPEIHTADIANSLRSGTIAMNFALDGIRSGRSGSILVTASDCRLGRPRGEFESLIGDGGAALLFGDSNVVAAVEASHSVSNELVDVWRADSSTYLQSAEDRFILARGYREVVGKAVGELLGKIGLAPKDFAKFVLYSPDARSSAGLAKSLGFDVGTQLQDPLIGAIGHAGSASAFLMLAAALEEAKPGDRLLFASYGDGCDVFVLAVTGEIDRLRNGRGVKKHLLGKALPVSYEKYLLWRGEIDVEPLRRLDPAVPAPSAMLRDRRQILALYGQKCRRCGTPQYGRTRLCIQCQAKDAFDDYRFSDRKARVATYTEEGATNAMDLPRIMCVIDFEGGGRMLTELTDRRQGEVRIGLPVEMTFRKLQDVKGIHHYFWKCKSIQ
jgi:hydroxymethylglutaryl-CoA synthase